VAVLALAAAGCATVPTSGRVQPARAGIGQVQEYPQLIAVPPRPGWSQKQIVSGFLHASATFADGHAIARMYLAPPLSTTWHPGWAATVVAEQPQINIAAPRSVHIVGGGPATSVAHVNITGQRLATLTDNGQYQTSSGSQVYHFTLVRTDGRWRIRSLPSTTTLLLTKPDFVKVYQAHNLYFFGPTGTLLVPDPVFVPQQATDTDLARGLVTALLDEPQGWLSGATRTRFPAGTRLRSVKINGSSAVVNLAGAAAKASQAVREDMAAQLVWTLTSSSYSPSAIQSVQLEINGRGQRFQEHQDYSQLVPARPASGRLYLVSSNGVSALSGSALRPVPGLDYSFSAIAVSPQGSRFAGVVASGKRTSTVYSGALTKAIHLVPRQLNGGTCTSLSFDSRGDIWAAAGKYLWMLPPGKGAAVPVVSRLLASQTITDLRVAPDGVRVAMIIRNQNGASQVAIGAVTRNGAQLSIGPTVAVGAGIPDPAELAWYNAYNILVLAQPGPGARLYEVPVNGGAPGRIQAVPGTISITTNGAEITAATDLGRLVTSSGPDEPWQPVTDGRAPAYPG